MLVLVQHRVVKRHQGKACLVRLPGDKLIDADDAVVGFDLAELLAEGLGRQAGYALAVAWADVVVRQDQVGR